MPIENFKESLLLALAVNAEPRTEHEHSNSDLEDTEELEQPEQPAYWVEEYKLEHQYHNF